MARTQGGTANHQGRILERTVVPTFESHGFEIVAYSAWLKEPASYGTGYQLNAGQKAQARTYQ